MTKNAENFESAHADAQKRIDHLRGGFGKRLHAALDIADELEKAHADHFTPSAGITAAVRRELSMAESGAGLSPETAVPPLYAVGLESEGEEL